MLNLRRRYFQGPGLKNQWGMGVRVDWEPLFDKTGLIHTPLGLQGVHFNWEYRSNIVCVANLLGLMDVSGKVV